MSTFSTNHKKKPSSAWKRKQNKKKASRKFAESPKRDGFSSSYTKTFYLKPWKRA